MVIETLSDSSLRSPESLEANAIFKEKSSYYREKLETTLKRAENALDNQVEADPSYPELFEAFFALRILEQDFDAVTGALNVEKFHERLGELAKDYELDQDPKTGLIRLTSPTRNQDQLTFVAVSLDNLAIINTVGSHASGDRALSDIARGVFDLAKDKNLNPEDFTLYRTEGKDFCIVLRPGNFEDKELQNPQNLVKTLSENQISEIEVLDLPIRSKLNVSYVKYEDAVSIFNQAQEFFPIEQRTIFADDTEKFKYINQILMNTLDAQREYMLVTNMAQGVYTYLESAHSNNNGRATGDALMGQYAKQYYDGYLKKFLAGSTYSTWESFAVAFVDEPEKITSVLQDSAIDHTVRRIFNVWDTQDNLTKVVKDVITHRIVETSAGGAEPTSDSALKITSLAETTQEDRNVSLNINEYKIAHKPEILNTLDKLKNISQSVQDSMAPEIVKSLEVFLTDVYPVLSSSVTMQLNLANQRNLDLKKMCETALTMLDPSKDGSFSRLDSKADARFVLSLGEAIEGLNKLVERNLDPLTGLQKRNEFKRKSFTIIGDAIKNNREYAMCFGDMNDLNYASINGNREFGDAQLVLVGEALNKFKPEGGEIGRYAGDEMVALVPGDIFNGREFTETVDAYMQSPDQKIPRHKKAHPDFDEFNPRISWGVYPLSEAIEDFYNNLLPNEKIYSDEDRRCLREAIADHNSPYFEFYQEEITKFMLRVADYSVDFTKATSKANLLYKILYDENSGLITNNVPKDDRRWRSFNMRLTSAQKALKKFDLNTFAKLHVARTKAGTRGLTVAMVEGELGNHAELESDAYKVAVTKVTEQLIRDRELLMAKQAKI